MIKKWAEHGNCPRLYKQIQSHVEKNQRPLNKGADFDHKWHTFLAT